MLLAPVIAAVGITTGMVVLPIGEAGASTCAPAASCSLTGTATLSAGSLVLSMGDNALSWSSSLTGAALSVYDANTSDQYIDVTDATGSGLGWKVTVAATTFTSGSDTLSNSNTFSVNGSTTSISSTTAPSATCAASSTCTTPTNAVAYPAAITTAASAPSPTTIFNAAASTGMGQVEIGKGGTGTGTNPIGWWLAIPANAIAGSYTSTITVAVSSGP